MYVCVYIYIYTYIYTHTHTYTNLRHNCCLYGRGAVALWSASKRAGTIKMRISVSVRT